MTIRIHQKFKVGKKNTVPPAVRRDDGRYHGIEPLVSMGKCNNAKALRGGSVGNIDDSRTFPFISSLCGIAMVVNMRRIT